ncbi:MAG: type I 3-dehydroquinate dehydratase [Candidatus Cloacimonetes bacterium]|nr:type I 3-dehydroquinate dehydratase [Candidatus Cloacimonadota bacterium]
MDNGRWAMDGEDFGGMVVISLVPESKEQILRLRERYADYFFEFRLDLADNWNWLDKETVDEQVILTLRDPSEAGDKVLQQHLPSLEEKIELYQRWQQEFGCLVDLELGNWNFCKQLNRKKLILSWHKSGDWAREEVAKKLKAMQSSGCRFGKIALEISDWKGFGELNSVTASAKTDLLVAFQGNAGISQRCLYRFIGAKGIYACLPGRETADGQPDMKLVEKLDLVKLTGKEKLSGIIGGEQIIKSLGLEYYNKLYKDHNLPAVYLPFIVEEAADFIKWVKLPAINEKITGFSVTMPWKEQLATLLGSTEGVINFWDGRELFLNTDLAAMEEILEELAINKTSKILVAGSGGSAITALKALRKFHCQVDISARNFPRAIDLAKEYKIRYIIPENTTRKHYTLFINATTLGMKSENILDMIGSRKFEAALDLPYNDQETPLEAFCRTKNRKYISGRYFWQKQSQEKYFLKKS